MAKKDGRFKMTGASPMLAEQTVHLLAAAGIDFMAGGARKREVYLYPDELLADGVVSLTDGRVVKVTFEYTDMPNAGTCVEEKIDLKLQNPAGSAVPMNDVNFPNKSTSVVHSGLAQAVKA